jgi:pimeloyl-ACP methyl ester carboxylesterase
VSLVCTLALALALLVLVVNGSLYLWRAQRLRTLPACDAVDPLGVFHAAAAFATECAALAAVVLSIPLGWALPRGRTEDGRRGPIVLVHGWGLNAGSLWYLRRRLRRDGWGPVCCLGAAARSSDIAGAAQALRQMIQELGAGNLPLALIGHGVGGLVVRYCVRRYPLPVVRRIITLGTPHFGTAVARVGRLRHRLAPEAPLINKLNAVDHVPQQFDVIAIHSTFDALVPPGSARYPGAFNIQVNDVGHTALLFSAKVYELIAENLTAPLH